MKKKLSLSAKVFIGFGAGIVIGLIFGEKALILKPVGDLFLRLIKMLIAPLVLCSITAGICSMGDMTKLRRIGAKTLAYFILTTMCAAGISMLIANVVRPGSGLTLNMITSGGKTYEASALPSLSQTLVELFPDNIFASLTNGTLVQIIAFSIFMGVAIILLGKNGERLRTAFNDGAEMMYKITAIVMEFSPYGVTALIACSVGGYGLKIFGPLAMFIGTVYAALIAVCAMYAVMLLVIAKVPLSQFFRKIPELWLMTASTTSSSGSLPVTIAVTRDKLGVSEDLASFVLPLGATMNMNGGACFYAATVLFVSHLYGIPLSLGQQFFTIILTVLVSVGCPGVPGGAIIMSTMLLTTMGLPLEVVGMIAGIFRLIDMGTTTMNCTGDVVTALCIGRGEKMIDDAILNNSAATTNL
jgi:Na+/H+-dicarboxylate symporter